MKALRVRCEAKEGVVCHQHTHLEYKADQLEQYKEATRILNVELTKKKTKLEATTHRCQELAKSNINLMIELATLCEQIKQTESDTVAEYQTSQPFYDELGGLHGDDFKDCLK